MTVYINFSKFSDKLSKLKISNSSELVKKIAEDTGVFILPDSDFGRGDLKEFGCTISLVDFDPEKVLKNISTSSVDEKFIKNNCSNIYDGVNKLGEWIKKLDK